MMPPIAALLGSMVLVITVICAFLITALPRRAWIKFILIPIVLGFGLFTTLNVTQLMGYPYAGYPTDKVTIQEVRLASDSHGASTIEFWALDKFGRSRLYVIPFDPDIFNRMRTAVADARAGTGVTTMKFHKGTAASSEGLALEGEYSPLVKQLPAKPERETPDNEVMPGGSVLGSPIPRGILGAPLDPPPPNHLGPHLEGDPRVVPHREP